MCIRDRCDRDGGRTSEQLLLYDRSVPCDVGQLSVPGAFACEGGRCDERCRKSKGILCDCGIFGVTVQEKACYTKKRKPRSGTYPEEEKDMFKVISTVKAPAAIGPYSQAVSYTHLERKQEILRTKRRRTWRSAIPEAYACGKREVWMRRSLHW